MVGRDELNRAAEHGSSGVLDRHACGQNQGRPSEIAIQSGLIIEHANAKWLLLGRAAPGSVVVPIAAAPSSVRRDIARDKPIPRRTDMVLTLPVLAQ